MNGAQSIAFDGALFEPSPGGSPAYILDIEDRFFTVFDRVAWRPGDERRWWLRYGAAGLLGERALWLADCLEEPVQLWATPADWLRAELGEPGNHCCVVDWSADPRRLLAGAIEVQCMGGAVLEMLERRIAECSAPGFRLAVAHG